MMRKEAIKMATNKGSRKVLWRDARGYTYLSIGLDDLVPDPENPRIPPQDVAGIDTLLALLHLDPDKLYNLADDIVSLGGTNPAELFNVTALPGGRLLVKEGNRRVAARQLLANPEQLRGHVGTKELSRWKRLGDSDEARKLSREVVAVLGEDHDAWVQRRHQGPQDGVGLQSWGPEARARDMENHGVGDRTTRLIESLKKTFPQRFEKLNPPKGTFTVIQRVVEAAPGKSHLGIDVDENGRLRLNRGEKSLRLIEEILGDLQKSGSEKLTSRRINKTDALRDYLDEVEERITGRVSEAPITLTGNAEKASSSGKTVGKRSGREQDILKSFNVPSDSRVKTVLIELQRIRKTKPDAPNAAMVVTRVLLELAIHDYAANNSLPFASDTGAGEDEVKAFRKTLSQASITIPKVINEALKFAGNKPMSLPEKLHAVIDDLKARKVARPKEAEAKKRELGAEDVFHLLNDAVHRLEVVPSMDRVTHILKVIRPVFNWMYP
ncbi:MAG TPA: hypothetical protein VGQ46_18785 [Thermoanaerobaculia bacterium]|nr:hypothetical protein [Thermoanaerobaculia bacterium]